MDYSIDDTMSESEVDYVERRLVEFGDRVMGPRNYQGFSFALRDARGNVAGGIIGHTVWEWLHVETLWIEQELRGRGFGHQLLTRAEELAKQRGCTYSRLNTFEFEAREFYEAHGYYLHHQTNDFPSGHIQYHLTKEL